MRLVYRAGLWLVTILALVWVLFPFYWAFLNSIKTPDETFQPTWIPFLQFQPTLEHWRSQLATPEIRHALLNSTIISIGAATIALLLGTLAAYALARFRFKRPSNGALTTWFISQRVLPPVMGSLLEFRAPSGETVRRVYLSGDTLPFDGIRQIREHIGEVDRGVLHLGGTTLPGGIVVTMDGRMGADVLETVAPRRATPIHFDDYDRFRSPLSDFTAEVERRGWADRVDYVARGETIPL